MGEFSIKAKYALIGDDLNIMENVEIVVSDRLVILAIDEVSQPNGSETVVMPGLYNAHSHAGDYGLRGVKPDNLAKLVGPNGIKMKYLDSISEHRLRLNLEHFHHENYLFGARGYNDFREGGYQGLLPYVESEKLRKRLICGDGSKFEFFDDSRLENMTCESVDALFIDRFPLIQILARPRTVEETPLLLNHGGIGFRDVRQYEPDDMIWIAKRAQSKLRQVHIHAGEDPQLTALWQDFHGVTDVEWSIRSLHANSIVHGNHSTQDDLDLIKATNTGLILCPRSYEFTNTKPPDYAMLKKSDLSPLQMGLGSDNAMFHYPILWKEVKSVFDNSSFHSREILQMATVGGARTSGLTGWSIEKGNCFTGIKLFFPRPLNTENIYRSILFEGRNAGIMSLCD